MLIDMNTEFGARLREARKAANVTQATLAKKVGIGQSTVAELEKSGNGSSHVPAIAAVLGCSALWLATGEGAMKDGFDKNVTPTAMGMRPYPVISHVQAGALKEIAVPYGPGDGFDVEYGDDDASQWSFFLEIEGDSMLPDFRPGDRVLIDPDVSPNPGDFVAARNTKEEATFKKYRVRGLDASGNEVFELVPLNDNYPVLRSDEQHLRVIGTMIEHRRKFRRK